MIDKVSFHVAAYLDSIVDVTPSSEDTGTQAINAMDTNPFTYWVPEIDDYTGANFVIDFGTAKQVDSVFLVIRNCDVPHFVDVASLAVVRSSANGTDWDLRWLSLSDGEFTQPGIALFGSTGSTIDLPATARYWQFLYSDMLTRCELASLLLCRSFAIDRSPAAPFTLIYAMPIAALASGVGTIDASTIRDAEYQTITYQFNVTATELATILSAYELAQGDRFPVVVQYDTDVANLILCRFASPIEYQQFGDAAGLGLFTCRVVIRTIPIPLGARRY